MACLGALMPRYRFLLLACSSLVTGCSDDKAGDAKAETPPPPPVESGELGAARFRYRCTAPSDAQCDFDKELGTGVGGKSYELPLLALGSTFALDLESVNPPDPPPEIRPLHPTYAERTPDGLLRPLKKGKTSIGVRRGDEIVDFVNVRIAEIAGLKLFSGDPQGKLEDVDVGKGSVTVKQSFTFRFRVAPIDSEAKLLAGSLPCKWTTSNEAVIKITTPADDNIVTVVSGAAGQSTLTVELGERKVEIPITIGGS
jgi:hypothetical protein